MKPKTEANRLPAAVARLVLKVDVDTLVGLKDGVPRLLELLHQAGSLKASFFVAMGPDNSGRALKRIFRPGFLSKQLKSGAAASYGLRTMLYGVLLPAPIIAASAPQILSEIINQNHELGVHGWDHVFWHDYLRKLEPARVRRELEAAARMFQSAVGFPPASFASPGWQITGPAWESLRALGITHTSCTRGKEPFRPLVRGRALPILELPTTMPTLDEALSLPGLTPGRAAAYLAGRIKEGELNVFTLHGEVEGRNQAAVFQEFLALLRDRKVTCLTLAQAAGQELAGEVKSAAVAWGRIPRRIGSVSCQESCLKAGGEFIC